MTESTERRKKPDGSAYKAHMEDVERRNLQVRKEGKARRLVREEEQSVAQRATERRQNAGLRGKGTRKGKAELR